LTEIKALAAVSGHQGVMLLDVRLLSPDDTMPTFALARLYESTLTPETWAARLARPRSEGGVFGGFAGAMPRALLSYDVALTSADLEILVVRWVTAFDLIDPHRIAADLVAAVQARQTAAGGFVAWAPDPACHADFEAAVTGGAVLHSVL
jgi:hypothetical protein